MFATIKNLICCKAGLKVGGKTSNIAFQLVCSNVAKQVARFCWPFYHRVKGAVTAVQFILFNFANYSPSVAMELKVSNEITGKWQNQRSEKTNMPPEHYFLSCKHQGSTLINCYAEQFSKTLISILFKLPQFCPSVASVVSVMLSGYFHVSLNLTDIL